MRRHKEGRSPPRYRQADAFASAFRDEAGPERVVSARLAHGRETISKVVKKRQLALVEKVVAGVDRACGADVAHVARKRIRSHAIEVLVQGGERALARDLNDAWTTRDGVVCELGFDDSADLVALDDAARRLKYVQWDDLFPEGTPTPTLVDDGDAFLRRVLALRGAVGFDVEWADDRPGAALLQLGTTTDALVVDVPKLSATSLGADALRSAFTHLRGRLVGFGCSQDLGRLRATPRPNGDAPWLPQDAADFALDLQTALKVDRPNAKQTGLSACSEEYLGKPLDKAMQCSRWGTRPLSDAQLVYAALDAVVVAKIYDKLPSDAKRAAAKRDPPP